jgi:hypothetical protein
MRQTSVSLFGRAPFLRSGHDEEGAPRAEAVKERDAQAPIVSLGVV